MCFSGILAEEVFLLDIVCTLFSRQRLLAVCHIADEIEIIHIRHSLICFQSFQINTHCHKGLFDSFLLIRCFPLVDEVRQRSILALDVGSRVINNIFLSEQFAVGIIDRNGLIDNFHSASVFIDDRSFNRVNGRFFSSAAMTAAQAFGNIPVVFAKKGDHRNVGNDVYTAEVYSFTHQKLNAIRVSRKYLRPGMKVTVVEATDNDDLNPAFKTSIKE